MKEYQSDNKLAPIDEEDIDSIKVKSNNNADLEYLLSYINVKQGQQLNLIEHELKQNRSSQILSSQLVCKYIRDSCMQQNSCSEQKLNLISIIDAGMRLISRVRLTMQRKKSNHKSPSSNQKNKSQPNQSSVLRELFFPQKQTQNHNKNTKTINNGINHSNDKEMKQLRLQQQVRILLNKSALKDSQKDNQNLNPPNYKYLLTLSLYQQLQHDLTANNDPKTKQIIGFIDQLQKALTSLEQITNRMNDYKKQKQYEIQIDKTWACIERLSQFFPNCL